MVFGKSKRVIPELPVVEESLMMKNKNEIDDLKKEIEELEKETSDELEEETDEEETDEEETTEEEPEKKSKGAKPKETKQYLQVVKELPQQQVRKHIDEETGIITNFITIEEALTKIMGKI